MRRRLELLVVMAVASATAGCMSHFEVVGSTRTPLAAHVQQPLPGQPVMHADVQARPDRLLVWLRLVGTCGLRQDVLVTERDVMKIRASEGRYVPVVLLLAASAVAWSLTPSDDSGAARILALGYTGSAALFWLTPLLAERDKTLSESSHFESRELPPVSCALQPLADVRVTLRAGGHTLERQSDARGVVSFDGVTSTSDIELFVEDRAVQEIVVHAPGRWH